MSDDHYLAILAAERAAAQFVVRLVEEGFTVDEALGLVEFPEEPE